MESSGFEHQHYNNFQKQMNSGGLTRYQSAPSSYFSSFVDRDFSVAGDEFMNRVPSPETERIFEEFLNSTTAESMKQTDVKIEEDVLQQQKHTSYSGPQGFYQSQSQQQLQNRYSSYGGMDRLPPQPPPRAKLEGGGGGNSNLIRHSSSPAGLFDNIHIENGYVVVRGMGGGGNSSSREASFNPASKPPPSPSRPMNPLPETRDQTDFTSWDESSSMMSGPKGLTSEQRTVSDTKNVEAANRPPPLLAHHLSLPKSLSEMSEIEKLLQMSDSVPCKVRAKRGCATHPRSIAERVRRTKISERMKKLQDLVPNMDKQTNTADMLDLAVDYIKELQQQVKTLSDDRDNCTCSNTHER